MPMISADFRFYEAGNESEVELEFGTLVMVNGVTNVVAMPMRRLSTSQLDSNSSSTPCVMTNL